MKILVYGEEFGRKTKEVEREIGNGFGIEIYYFHDAIEAIYTLRNDDVGFHAVIVDVNEKDSIYIIIDAVAIDNKNVYAIGRNRLWEMMEGRYPLSDVDYVVEVDYEKFFWNMFQGMYYELYGKFCE